MHIMPVSNLWGSLPEWLGREVALGLHTLTGEAARAEAQKPRSEGEANKETWAQSTGILAREKLLQVKKIHARRLRVVLCVG